MSCHGRLLICTALLLLAPGCPGSGGTPSSSSAPAAKSQDELGFEQAIQSRIEGKEDLDVPGEGDPLPPLLRAAARSYADGAELLIKGGADVNLQESRSGTTPLREGMRPHSSKNELSLRLATALLAAGADPDLPDNTDNAPLHKAAQHGRADLVRLLLENKAAVDVTDALGQTPLHKAAGAGAKEVVEVLLAGGADRAAADSRGRTPLELAQKRERQGQEALLPGLDYDGTIQLLE